MYIILYIQYTQFFKNVYNYVFLMYTTFHVFILHVYKFQGVYTIPYIQYTQFLKEFTLFCTFNWHEFENNVQNSIHSKCTHFQRM